MTKKTTKRQDFILEILQKKDRVPISQITDEVSKSIKPVSKITVNRDLGGLIKLGFVRREGGGRAATYLLSKHFHLIREIPIEDYFKKDPDQRDAKKSFNFQIFSFLKDVFTDEEKKWLQALEQEYHGNIRRLSPVVIKKEMERLIIEFSWKSSQIEGNTYTLLETETLLKEHHEAKGHRKDEATMLLNHKNALDFIWENKKEFRAVSTVKIEHLHSIITKDLGISKNIRSSLVGITGTAYQPIDNQWQIKEALSKTSDLVNQEKDPFSKSLIVSAMIAYIQPFEDGNKRIARILGNALLLANDSCPLSYRSASEAEYKKAVLLFFEQNNISYYKKLFLEQYEFAVKNYFRS
ncbi:MAG: Fic family protein [Candidatus Liptonbacteria bacterium]|nr:Fic family protein [Candidatus Liptonbacteria bacterium]